jgi:hypothetical protein
MFSLLLTLGVKHAGTGAEGVITLTFAGVAWNVAPLEEGTGVARCIN